MDVCAIHIAARHDALDAFIHLHSCGAGFDTLSMNHPCPIHAATQYGSTKVLKYILDQAPGLIETCQCCDGQTPLANTAVVMLLEAGARLDAVCSPMNAPWIHGLMHSHPEYTRTELLGCLVGG